MIYTILFIFGKGTAKLVFFSKKNKKITWNIYIYIYISFLGSENVGLGLFALNHDSGFLILFLIGFFLMPEIPLRGPHHDNPDRSS